MRKKHHRVMIIIKKQDQVPSRNKRRSQITGKGFITKIIIKKKDVPQFVKRLHFLIKSEWKIHFCYVSYFILLPEPFC